MYVKNPGITIEEVKTNLEMRDYLDSNREFSPLRKAADAVELDNSAMTREEQLSVALGWAKERMQ
jgi:cytidylate kinase